MREKIKIDAIEQHVIDCVRKLRKGSGLRQRDLANILETSASFIGNVENVQNPAKYNLKHISRLATYFEVSPKYFLPDYTTVERNDVA